jgi:hypothetical protein
MFSTLIRTTQQPRQLARVAFKPLVRALNCVKRNAFLAVVITKATQRHVQVLIANCLLALVVLKQRKHVLSFHHQTATLAGVSIKATTQLAQTRIVFRLIVHPM